MHIITSTHVEEDDSGDPYLCSESTRHLWDVLRLGVTEWLALVGPVPLTRDGCFPGRTGVSASSLSLSSSSLSVEVSEVSLSRKPKRFDGAGGRARRVLRCGVAFDLSAERSSITEGDNGAPCACISTSDTRWGEQVDGYDDLSISKSPRPNQSQIRKYVYTSQAHNSELCVREQERHSNSNTSILNIGQFVLLQIRSSYEAGGAEACRSYSIKMMENKMYLPAQK
jgi:hypothetical protein